MRVLLLAVVVLSAACGTAGTEDVASGQLPGSDHVHALRATDGGRSFERVTEWGTIGLAFAADGTVLAATQRGADVSSDAGQSWDDVAAVEDFDGQPLAVAVGSEQTWWVMTEQPRVLYRGSGTDEGFTEVART